MAKQPSGHPWQKRVNPRKPSMLVTMECVSLHDAAVICHWFVYRHIGFNYAHHSINGSVRPRIQFSRNHLAEFTKMVTDCGLDPASTPMLIHVQEIES